MKNICKAIGRLAILACLVIGKEQASAKTLPVPYYAQRSFYAPDDTNQLNNLSQWCWNASSEMVMNTPLSDSYPGTFFTQDEIAAYGSEGSNYWNFIWGSSPRSTNNGVVRPALKGIDMVLKNFGSLTSKKVFSALSKKDLQTEIDAGRPCIARLGWSSKPVGQAYVNDNGGHFVVLYGFDGTVVEINDPWPDNGPVLQNYTTFSDASGKTYVANGSRFKWTHTLTLGASLDVCFLIDTTGSMGGEINDVKTRAIALTSNIFRLFPDARIAVKNYKDMPEPLYDDGDSDYLDQINSPFTTNRNAIANAVNPLTADGGGDTPEALYSSLLYTINNTSWSGGSLGGWRANPTPRIIIVATDASGHNPEPWAGGHSAFDVFLKANTPDKEIAIYGLDVGGGGFDDLDALASATGGSVIDASDDGGVSAGILEIINQVADSTRRPQGSVASAKPKFVFEKTQVGMGGVPTQYVVQIEKLNTNIQPAIFVGNWELFLQAPITGSTFTPSAALPLGTYRWRLGAVQPATTLLSPGGNVLSTIPSEIIFEDEFTQFERTTAVPADATILSPSTFFSYKTTDFPASKKKLFLVGKLPITFTFAAGYNATSYFVTIESFDAKAGTWSTLKTLTVKPPTSNPLAQTLSFTTTGIKPNVHYRWSIVSLNADFPTPSSR